jgi:hypothetical protein
MSKSPNESTQKRAAMIKAYDALDKLLDIDAMDSEAGAIGEMMRLIEENMIEEQTQKTEE